MTPTSPGEADAAFLTPQQAEAIVRVVEAGPHVRRRYQFFVWTQSQLQALLPHQILACGAYQRQRRDLVFEAFHSIVLASELLALLTDTQGPLLRALLAAWVEARARPLVVDTARLAGSGADEAVLQLRQAGIDTLLVHGVARPQRPAEVESFFVLASQGRWPAQAAVSHLDLLLPHLHTVWLRVVAAERELAPPTPAPRAQARAATPRGVTDRERQILSWVREGKSNQQIAEVLGISPLTVKNHVQKILRKLGASNRAQAVAEAMALGLLDRSVA
ncbi:MAG: XrtB/PEP-CTERM-associated transcriptional regulator EpsA [Rubrivivax sp.]